MITISRPGLMAWSAVSVICLLAWLLPDSETGNLLAATALATGIVLLATARCWRNQRWLTENILLLPALLATGLSITHTPDMVQVGLTPVLLIFTALPILAWNEWRFAPDFGQTGFMWALTGGVRGTLWAGLGLAIAMIMRAVFNLDTGMATAAIYAGCAGLGRGCGALLMPLNYSMHPAVNLTFVAESHSATHTEDNSADWWKDR
ncbi:MAG: hypothetical protein H7A44_04830 [Opitutaceae bacterium]|nr:hypothetical protein [Cephaloticoccus sp.]MCP5529747.1 hypothetical protein [Opitutaceae bacterium]